MAKHRKHRSSKKSRRNPFFGKKQRRHYRRSHRRNPIFGGSMSGKNVIELTLGAVAGAVGSGYLSQMVLGANNVGMIGYLGDLIATGILAWAATKFAGGDVAKGVIAGGGGALVSRIWRDNISGTSSSMSGVGNRDFAGLGYYVPRNFPLPTATGQYMLPGATPQGGTIMPGAAAGVSAAGAVSAPVTPPNPAPGGSKRFGGRFH